MTLLILDPSSVCIASTDSLVAVGRDQRSVADEELPRSGLVQCSSCHRSTHLGTLVVEGDKVQRPNAPAPSHVGSRLDHAIVRTQARDALVGLGWKPNIARTAVDEARSHVGCDVTLEELIWEALRRCPRPAS
jgi:cytochrome c peroxidase